MQAFFAAHTAELHVCVARSNGWLGSNRVENTAPPQGAGIIAFESPAGLLQACYVDGEQVLRRVHRRANEEWSAAEQLPMPPAPSGAGLAQGFLAPDSDFVVLIDSQGHVASSRVRGSAAGAQLERLQSSGPLGSPGGAVVALNQAVGLLSVVFCHVGSRRLQVIWRSAADALWQGPAPIDALAPTTVSPTAALAACSLGERHWFVIHVTEEGVLRAAHVDGTSAWLAPQSLSVAGFAPPDAGVAALRQTPTTVSAFVVDNTGAVQSFWRREGELAWSGPRSVTGPGAARPGAGLVAAKQSDDESILVFVAADGRPSVCWTFGDGSWQGPALISRYRVDEPFVLPLPSVNSSAAWAPLVPPGRRDAATWIASRFETWLTGPDSANHQPFYVGADLGANTEHRGSFDSASRLFIFFGDTTVSEPDHRHDPATLPPFDGDMIGIIDSPNVVPRMTMTIVPGPASAAPGHTLPGRSFQPFTMDRAGTLGSVETPTGAFSHGGRIYVFAEVNATRPVCYLTSSLAPESATPFELLFEVSRTRFIQVAPWLVTNSRHPGLPSNTGAGVVMIGRGAEPPDETDAHFLAWMPIGAHRLPRRDDLLFYAGVADNGLRWSAHESDAVAVGGASLPGYSSVSLNWVAGPDCWVLLYTRARSPTDQNPRRERLGPIVARLSHNLYTWSDEVSLFDPNRDKALCDAIGWGSDSWAYGPFLLSRFHSWDPVTATLTLRYLASSASPYQVHVQSSQLVVEGDTQQHVFCRTADDRLTHLWWSSDTAQVQSEDWTALVSAPAMGGDPSAIATLGRLSVFFRDARGGIAHVFRDLVSGDVHLATASTAQLRQPAAGDPVLLATPGQLHIFYRGVDGSLQHLVKSLPGPDAEPPDGLHAFTLAMLGPDSGTGADSWVDASAPLLAGDPALMTTDAQQHAFYRDAHGSIEHVVWSAGAGFGHDNWTRRAAAPAAVGDPAAVTQGQEQHVFYRGADGAILHLQWTASLAAPQVDNWTQLSGAPPAAGDPAVMATAGQLHVFYRSGTGSVIHMVRNAGEVRPGRDDWTANAHAGVAASDPRPLETPGQQHVFFRTERGDVQHVFWQSVPGNPRGVFAGDDWTQRAHAPLSVGRPAVLFTRERAAPSATRILALGDSITQGLIDPASVNGGHLLASLGGYRSHLFELIRPSGKAIAFVGSLFDGPLTVDGVTFGRSHEGHAGKRAQEIESIAVSVAQRTRPDIVLLMVGTNDVLTEAEPGDVANALSHLRGLVSNLRRTIPEAMIFVAKIPPIPNHILGQVNYNVGIQTLFEHRRVSDPRLRLVDMTAGFTVDMLSDGVHPTDEGYAHMASKWFASIAPHL
jgi:lysophospholipase L1-like esterase